MKFEIHGQSLRIEGEVNIREIESLHQAVTELGLDKLNALDLSGVTDLDFCAWQWLYVLRKQKPNLHWIWPERSPMSWLWAGLEN